MKKAKYILWPPKYLFWACVKVRPKYILVGYMDTYGFGALCRRLRGLIQNDLKLFFLLFSGWQCGASGQGVYICFFGFWVQCSGLMVGMGVTQGQPWPDAQ